MRPKTDVKVQHALCDCPGSRQLKPHDCTLEGIALVRYALEDCGSDDAVRAKIWFVGKCVGNAMLAYLDTDSKPNAGSA